MKIIYPVFILFFIGFNNTAAAQSPPWQWVKSSAGSDSAVGNGIHTDAHGNSYVIGSFSAPTVTFGNITLTRKGDTDFFLVRYDSAGNALWGKCYGETSQDNATAVTTDIEGNCYVTGYFTNPIIIFGNDTLYNTDGNPKVFLVKYDAAGNMLWATSAGGFIYGCQGYAVSTDMQYNVYLTGYFQDYITFGNQTLTGPGAFIAKYDSSVTVQWAQQAADGLTTQNLGIGNDANGNVYLTGSFGGNAPINFDTITIPAQNDYTICVVKYNPSGNAIWGKYATSPTNGNAVSVSCTDADGNTYMTGYFQSDVLVFGSDTIIDSNIFTVKYDSAGDVLWAKGAGSEYNPNEALAISTDGIGNCYITGLFADPTIAFDNYTLINEGGYNVFVAKYDTWGNVAWVKSVYGEYFDEGAGISNDAKGNTYLTGFFTSQVVAFDTDTLANNGVGFFIAKIENENYTNIAGSFCAGSVYVFNGGEIDSGGIYTDTLTNVFGGDSIIILTLTEYRAIHDTVYVNLCNDSTYIFGDSVLSVAGIYTDTFTAQTGCDSIVTVNISVNQPVNVSLSWQQMMRSGLLVTDGYDTTECYFIGNYAVYGHPVPLLGGSPPGGTYSGEYVSGDSVYNYVSYPHRDNITYTVNRYGCSDSASDELTISYCEGVVNVALENEISVYPNPTGDVLFMQCNLFNADNVEPVVYDITGRKVYASYSRQGDIYSFNVAQLSAGVYFIHISVDGNEAVKKFVKAE